MALLFGSFCSGCQKEPGPAAESPLFDSIPSVKTLNPVVNEISGITDSKTNPGFLWAQEDSGTPTQIYLVKHDGTVTKRIFLKGIINRDWEDMDLYGGHIFIGEIGDNAETYGSYRFYRFPEPSSSADTIYNAEEINFTYPDGSHDAEAFVVDPVTKDIYIITKRDNPSKLYRLSFPYAADNVLTDAGSLSYNGVVGAAISADGKEIILKTYTGLQYYPRNLNETIAQALQKASKPLSYTIEPQGEAICFATNGAGFYTVSEKGFASWVNLYFYKRN